MKTDEQSVRPTGPGPDEKGPAGVGGTTGRSTIFGRLRKWWGWVTKKDWDLMEGGSLPDGILGSCPDFGRKWFWQLWQHRKTGEIRYIEL